MPSDAHPSAPALGSGLRLAAATFGLLWAAAMLFSLLSDYPLGQSAWSEPAKWIGIAAAGWLALAPAAPGRLLAMALTMALTVLAEMPAINNHGVLILFSCVACIGAWVARAISQRRIRVDPEPFYRTLAPVLRAELLVLYFWAAVHKLNTDYFDPEVSCATTQLLSLRGRAVLGHSLDFLPTGSSLQYASMAGTLLLETAIPLLLLVRRTRTLGVMLAAPFHFVLGLSYPVFSATLYAALTVFLPVGFWDGLRAAWDRRFGAALLERRSARAVRRAVTIVYLVAVTGFLLRYALGGEPWRVHLSLAARTDLWFAHGLLCLLVLTAAAVVAGRRRFSVEAAGPGLGRGLWLLPVLVFLNGLGPHLGFKDTLSFSMFSNLRTSGGTSNHLLIPETLQRWHHLRDLVRIHGSSDPVLNELSRASWRGAPLNESFVSFIQLTPELEASPPPTWRLPYASLRQRITWLARRGSTDIRLVYERGGQLHHVAHAESDPELSSFPYFLHKVLRLRAVPDLEPSVCMW